MVETSPLPEGTKRYDPSVVKNFLSTALIRVGVEPDDALSLIHISEPTRPY